jgi:hypothetical protein
MSSTGRARRWTPLSLIGALSSRQVDALLGLSVAVAVLTGITSWAVGTEWSRAFVAIHAIAGLGILVLVPAKLAGSVRTGFRRNRASRWISSGLGLLVLATIALGVAHSTGLWYGVGYWSALWTHSLLAAFVVILVGWHVLSRPSRPSATDLDRRALLGGLSVTAVAALSYSSLEALLRVADLDGASRRFTGSHERGSFDPDAMPTVQWIDDTAPRDVDPATWPLVVDGRATSVASISSAARTVEADLDCTGGWWSRQAWDVVPLSEILPDLTTRSIEVTSSTGYTRLFPASEAETTFVAVGYGGRALRRGHGAPVRIVAPGRRGPWWVKWVVRIEPSDRPWWAQSPFPLT